MRRLILALALAASSTPAMAQELAAGPVFTSFGKVAKVDSDMPLPKTTRLKVVLDLTAAGKPDEINRTLDTAARFINMHVAAGVPEANIRVAIVVHGPASGDLVKDATYAAKHDGKPNPNTRPIAELLAHHVEIYLCGQAAAHMGIAKTDLLPGVKMALSAMTAHALLQQQGYTEIP